MDFGIDSIDGKMVNLLEREFNKVVDEKRTIRIYTTSREEIIKTIDARRRKLFERVPDFVKEVRVIEIDGIVPNF